MLIVFRKRKFLYTAGALYFLIYLCIEWHEFSHNKISRIEVPFEVKTGSTIRHVIRDLKSQDIKLKPIVFELYTRLQRAEKLIHAGEYVIKPEMTSLDLYHMLVNGDVVMRKFTIVEGWNVRQLFKEMSANPFLKDDLKENSSAQHEGSFYPETYEFAKNTRASKILNDAKGAMKTILDEEWKQRDKSTPYKNSYEALIAASLIEKETAIDSERELVSAVIANRLKKRMFLQIDPTVIYGLGETYNGKISRNDLKKDTPYNTYTRKGLPPTPIAFPRLASIKAALHPAKSEVLYFVAKGDGGHIFSNNLNDHIAAVKKWREKSE